MVVAAVAVLAVAARHLDPHPEALDAAVVLLDPMELRRQRQRHLEHRPRDRLRHDVDGEVGQHLHLRLDPVRRPLIGDQLADVADRHLAQRMRGCPLRLHLLVDVLTLAANLSNRRLHRPHPTLDRLRQPQRLLGVRDPAARERNLEDAARDPRRRLRDEHHVGGERERLDGEARDVRLHQHVRLPRLVAEPALDEELDLGVEVVHLLHLLLAHLYMGMWGVGYGVT